MNRDHLKHAAYHYRNRMDVKTILFLTAIACFTFLVLYGSGCAMETDEVGLVEAPLVRTAINSNNGHVLDDPSCKKAYHRAGAMAFGGGSNAWSCGAETCVQFNITTKMEGCIDLIDGERLCTWKQYNVGLPTVTLGYMKYVQDCQGGPWALPALFYKTLNDLNNNNAWQRGWNHPENKLEIFL